jgi:hypothetical protein
MFRLHGSKMLTRVLLIAVQATLVGIPCEAQVITVGKNVRVTAADPSVPHGEVVIAADPRDPSRLVSAAMAYFPNKPGATTVVYATTDSGNTWRKTLQHEEGAYFRGGADPTVAYGPGGRAYFATLSNMGTRRTAGPMHLFAYASPDGGQSWTRSLGVSEHEKVDRPFLSADTSGSPYHGRIYVFGQLQTKLLDMADPAPNQAAWAVALWRSRDSGRTFERPAIRARAEPAQYVYPGNATILSDGTVLGIYFAMDAGTSGSEFGSNRSGLPRNGFVRSIASRDGGESLEAAVPVSALHHDGGYTSFALPSMAADASHSAFRDRAYAVWTDGRSGRDEILLSYSSDAGRTWSAPRPVNDDRPFRDGSPGPDDFMPMVAVNQRGVVGVTWYDRRDNPANVGYYVRFAASLDGGETFLPSVLVSTAPKVFDREEQVVVGVSESEREATDPSPRSFRFTRKFSPASGHTAGLTVDVSGGFHPLWVDNRTGIDQLWTAAITVRGTATRNGTTALATLVDQAERVRLELARPSFDRRSSTLVTEARLRNLSARTVAGPLVVRLLRMTSSIGAPAAVNTDNGERGVGAVWDFGSLLSDSTLVPGAVTPAKPLVFQLADPRPFLERGRFTLELLSIDARVLGRPPLPAP